jgi:hypothetical protein
LWYVVVGGVVWVSGFRFVGRTLGRHNQLI